MTVAIVVAAGHGVRLGPGAPKALRTLAGRPLYQYSLETLRGVPSVSGVWLVVPPAAQADVATTLSTGGRFPFPIHVIGGGQERQDSVRNGVESLPQEAAFVVVHDAARPFASRRLFESCIAAAQVHGAAIAALPAVDTIKLVEAGVVERTLDRARTWVAQTPQVARADWLRHALGTAASLTSRFTDEAGVLEQCGYRVHVVPGEASNRKLTTLEDWDWAEWFARNKILNSSST